MTEFLQAPGAWAGYTTEEGPIPHQWDEEGKRLQIQCRRWAHGMLTCLHPWSLAAFAVGRFLMPSWEFLHCRGQAGRCGNRLQLCSIRSLAFILSASYHLLTRLIISNLEICIDDEVMMLSYVYKQLNDYLHHNCLF